jgi:ring-1,2-phenylacetyl-CoA epoxidase subunit PaaE
MNQVSRLKVKSTWKETPDTTGVLLEIVEGDVSDFKPGQFVTLIFDIEGKEIRRGYSIFTDPKDLPEIGLAIKKVEDGTASSYISEIIEEGLEIEAIGPAGTFNVNASPEKERDIVMFGAGSGITPLFSMLTSVLENEQNSRVILFYGNRNEKEIIFKERLESLEEKYRDRFTLFHTLTKPSENWIGPVGRICSEKMNLFFNKIKFQPSDSTEFYLCGPEDMMKDITDYLRGSGISREKIFMEHYKISILDESFEEVSAPREVTIIKGKEKHRVTVEPGDTILQTALDNNIELPNSCQYGSCGSCKAKIISGKIKLVEQVALSEEELEEGYCLTCVGYPVSESVVVYYDESF